MSGLARRVILILVLPWLLVIAFPVYVYLEGWLIAGLHTLLVVTWALLLTNIVLIRFRKIPVHLHAPGIQAAFLRDSARPAVSDF